jgi:hypothetical protein
MNDVKPLQSVAAPSWVVSLVSQNTGLLREIRCHPQHFGNFFVVFAVGGVEIRIIRDRGELRVEARHSSSSWLPVEQWKNLPRSIAPTDLGRVMEWALMNPPSI